jgi:hypothetical protein
MSFPTSPTLGETHSNQEGTTYFYNAKGAWQLKTIGAGYLPPVTTAALALSPAIMPAMIKGAAFSQAMTASGGTPTYSYAITNGVLPTGLSLSGGTISGTPTTAGPYSFDVVATDSAGTPKTVTNHFSGEVLSSGIGITPTLMPAMNVGTPFTQAMTASGGTGPYTWAVAFGSLPAGLSLNTSTGVISGTPTTAGSFLFALSATDSTTAVVEAWYSGVVAIEIISVTPSALPTLFEFVNIGVQFNASGGVAPYAWSTTGAVSGMSINAATGLLSGAPLGAGTFSMTVKATDANGVSKTVSLTGEVEEAILLVWKQHVAWPFSGYDTHKPGGAPYYNRFWRPFIDFMFVPTNLDPGGAFCSIDMNGVIARFPGGAPGSWSPLGVDLPTFATVTYPTIAPSPFNGWCYDGVGRHITVGATICWSLVLGTGWSLSSYSPNPAYPLFDCAFGVGLAAVAVGAGGEIIRTTDGGATWVEIQAGSPTGVSFFSVDYGAGLFVAVGCNKYVTEKPFGGPNDLSKGSGYVIFTSPDGVTWTQRNIPASVIEKLHKVRFINNYFVAVGGEVDGVLVYSVDGINWLDGSPRLSAGNTGVLFHVEYGPGGYGFVTVGQGKNAGIEYCGMWSCPSFGEAWVTASGTFKVWNGAPTLHGVCYGLNTLGAPMFMAIGNNLPNFSWGSPSAPDFFAAGLLASPIAIYSAAYD